MRLEDFDARVAYRKVYDHAGRYIERLRGASVCLHPESPTDVELVNIVVRDKLTHQLDGIDPQIIALAFDDAMAGRQPKW